MFDFFLTRGIVNIHGSVWQLCPVHHKYKKFSMTQEISDRTFFSMEVILLLCSLLFLISFCLYCFRNIRYFYREDMMQMYLQMMQKRQDCIIVFYLKFYLSLRLLQSVVIHLDISAVTLLFLLKSSSIKSLSNLRKCS